LPIPDKDTKPDEVGRGSEQAWEVLATFPSTMSEAYELAKQVKYDELQALFLTTQFFAYYSADDVDLD